jgi:hypothetical protein
LIVEALRLYGALEGPGTANNPKIIARASEIEKARRYPQGRQHP